MISSITIPAANRGGWEEAIAFLHGGAGDVVTSASVGDTSFPSPDIARQAGTWQPTGDEDDDGYEEAADTQWDALGAGQQWDLCMGALQATPWLQWHPGARYKFGPATLRRHAGIAPA